MYSFMYVYINIYYVPVLELDLGAISDGSIRHPDSGKVTSRSFQIQTAPFLGVSREASLVRTSNIYHVG